MKYLDWLKCFGGSKSEDSYSLASAKRNVTESSEKAAILNSNQLKNAETAAVVSFHPQQEAVVDPFLVEETNQDQYLDTQRHLSRHPRSRHTTTRSALSVRSSINATLTRNTNTIISHLRDVDKAEPSLNTSSNISDLWTAKLNALLLGSPHLASQAGRTELNILPPVQINEDADMTNDAFEQQVSKGNFHKDKDKLVKRENSEDFPAKSGDDEDGNEESKSSDEISLGRSSCGSHLNDEYDDDHLEHIITQVPKDTSPVKDTMSPPKRSLLAVIRDEMRRACSSKPKEQADPKYLNRCCMDNQWNSIFADLFHTHYVSLAEVRGRKHATCSTLRGPYRPKTFTNFGQQSLYNCHCCRCHPQAYPCMLPWLFPHDLLTNCKYCNPCELCKPFQSTADANIPKEFSNTGKPPSKIKGSKK